MNQRILWPALFALYLLALCLSLFIPNLPANNLPAGSDKLIHAAEFFFLSILALKNTAIFFPKARLEVFAFLFILAFATELVQLMIPSRSFSWLDYVADLFGITLGMIVHLVARW